MSSDGERLQKVLARAGVASRRGAEELIRDGRVTVDGRRAQLGMRVSADARIEVDGAPLTSAARPLTLMLHKPRGVLSAVRDDRGRSTVMDLVPETPGLHPIGRLDRDSEGLLLLTTDGELTLRLTHPRYGHTKSYRVWCAQGSLPDSALRRLERGIELDDGPARALQARRRPGGCLLVLGEGRNRQVRRMLAVLGFDVERLLRTHVGRLPLGDLAAGEWRELEAKELEAALATGESPGRTGILGG